MGMYTELVLKCEIKETAPEEVKEVLRYMFDNDGDYELDETPEHPFFKTPRWNSIGSCSSFYHHPKAVSNIYENDGMMYIFNRSDLKNYDNEISLFVDWVTPYIDGYGKVCIGWEWYEEEESPTLLFVEVS
jgi:hypothetical protein